MSALTLAEVTETIYAQLASLLADTAITRAELTPTTSLIDDLGLDSLKFVDLTLALEEGLHLEEFPMQEWVDVEASKDAPAFTVLALARACLSELEQSGRPRDVAP